MTARGRSDFSVNAFSLLRDTEAMVEYISRYVRRKTHLDHSVESVYKSNFAWACSSRPVDSLASNHSTSIKSPNRNELMVSQTVKTYDREWREPTQVFK